MSTKEKETFVKETKGLLERYLEKEALSITQAYKPLTEKEEIQMEKYKQEFFDIERKRVEYHPNYRSLKSRSGTPPIFHGVGLDEVVDSDYLLELFMGMTDYYDTPFGQHGVTFSHGRHVIRIMEHVFKYSFARRMFGYTCTDIIMEKKRLRSLDIDWESKFEETGKLLYGCEENFPAGDPDYEFKSVHDLIANIRLHLEDKFGAAEGLGSFHTVKHGSDYSLREYILNIPNIELLMLPPELEMIQNGNPEFVFVEKDMKVIVTNPIAIDPARHNSFDFSDEFYEEARKDYDLIQKAYLELFDDVDISGYDAGVEETFVEEPDINDEDYVVYTDPKDYYKFAIDSEESNSIVSSNISTDDDANDFSTTAKMDVTTKI